MGTRGQKAECSPKKETEYESLTDRTVLGAPMSQPKQFYLMSYTVLKSAIFNTYF